jgi:hypothetical protein
VGPVDVLLEGLFLLLQGLPTDVANVALVLLVVLQLVGLVPQAAKSVQHDTRYDVGQHSSEENAIDGIVGEPHYLKGFHRLPNGPRNIQSQNTLHHGLAEVLLRVTTGVDIFLIVAEGDRAEDKGEDDPHEADVEELGEFEADGFEDVADLGVVAENIHDVDEVERRIEESTHEGYDHVDGYSPELSAEVQRLSGVATLDDLVQLLQLLADL